MLDAKSFGKYKKYCIYSNTILQSKRIQICCIRIIVLVNYTCNVVDIYCDSILCDVQYIVK